MQGKPAGEDDPRPLLNVSMQCRIRLKQGFTRGPHSIRVVASSPELHSYRGRMAHFESQLASPARQFWDGGVRWSLWRGGSPARLLRAPSMYALRVIRTYLPQQRDPQEWEVGKKRGRCQASSGFCIARSTSLQLGWVRRHSAIDGVRRTADRQQLWRREEKEGRLEAGMEAGCSFSFFGV